MTTANDDATATGEDSPVAVAVQSHKEAIPFVEPWYATHRNTSHFERLRAQKQLSHCDNLAVDVSQKQSALQNELERYAQGNWRVSGYPFRDLFDFLYRLPATLGAIDDGVTTAKSNFESARERYDQECLRHEAQATAEDVSEFSVVDLPITIGGEFLIPEAPIGWVVAGYGALGVAMTAIGFVGSEMIVSGPVLSGLRLAYSF